ncbi:tRNA uridine-5-carboxymethylaminomethyl(34) synthesis GTPase MnmE [Methyloligella sp. 2.7D]|uniref:tRNA uridine-5-carboxymethylaminomethyl(34) synthesis GTPase MnmE n=1 Tax=unclassified Methyloligella TaxID=2625955 RepID=UPI00157BD2A6|nr:tRNA uridine-5-carboxymethylaminomethyl(34) synthesis GTPase MnmE [Methyloligella sp. GL2]QKP76269.1 tRNA uridine-5-carboxymethylaminomethyl(34) synthesis GTPase MnmE [Methyloligella sp. GL2]
MKTADTIAALASGQGRAAIAVFRISGDKTAAVLRALCGEVPPPRHASFRKVIDPKTGSLIDRGIVLWFPGPASFTGEDMAEIQCHGGRAVTEAVLGAILKIEGVRLADPGEFAWRAFETGKLDISEVEGLADLINAETAAQARQALNQAEGRLRETAESWRTALLRAQALAEASIDFSDESDVAAGAMDEAAEISVRLRRELKTELSRRSGEALRGGFRIVIAGPPNAGKSSLLNALSRRDVAIVSEEAGTTRDVLEVHLDLSGLPVILIDTAGLREAEGAVESEGIRRALERVRDADLILWLNDATVTLQAPPDDLAGKEFLPVATKVDLLRAPDGWLGISAVSGEGIDALLKQLSERALNRLSPGSAAPVITRARHRIEIEAAEAALRRFTEAPSDRPELKAEELRVAARHLGRLTGHIDVEEVLGAIFGEFCIGK